MSKFLSALALAGCIAAPTTAWGATINLTDAAVGAPAAGKTSYSVVDPETGVTVTFSGSNTSGNALKLSWESGDGLGIKGPNDNNEGHYYDVYNTDDWGSVADEIDENEVMSISFSENVLIESIALTDIYKSETLYLGYSCGWWGSSTCITSMNKNSIPNESGAWTVYEDGSEAGDGAFVGEKTRYYTNGELLVGINVLGDLIELVSTTYLNGALSPFKGFSLAGVTFSTTTKDVPELSAQGLGASAFLLLGAALLMADRRRRQPLAAL